MKTLDIECLGYSVKADIYEGDGDYMMISLIGLSSSRKKTHYDKYYPQLAEEQGTTTLVFDYSGHGDSPFELGSITPAENFMEVIRIFDWMRKKYPDKKMIVLGSSYGGYMATQLTEYREFDKLILRAPAIYRAKDFYTTTGNLDEDATTLFRKDLAALTSHPLLVQAPKFKGETLVVTHEKDGTIPVEVTDAYEKAFDSDTILARDLSHSLDKATPEQLETYYKSIFSWLKK